MTAVNCARWALRFQRAMDQSTHRVDVAMRRRAAEWWSIAEKEGLVLQ